MRDWRANYQDGDTPWDRGSASPLLLHWLQTFRSQSERSALVPGCGRGHEIVELAGQGFEVTGLDLVAQALADCQQKLDSLALRANLHEADVLSWKAPQPFDLIYEQTCLCAIDPQHWEDYEKQLRQWLHPRGTLVIALMQTGQAGGPPFDCPVERMRDLFSAWTWSEPIIRVDRAGASNHELGFFLRPQTEPL